ncbi:hypothetical protein PJK55_02505 [Exiguobacterium sp. MMG028]|uniref:hypothetical protein n=1 Tax=Exiguobacterium sp. MMG028 TaxID=3021979 RepID=UPI0022FEE681|nr:hypothetical protein [Exiguobacterium sp. MMG028]MDA5559593.1 hypothetical protein [Exiguobacterium sp. MMG028]
MKFEDLFFYDGMMHVFDYQHDVGSSRLTFQLQLLDHQSKRNTRFRERVEVGGVHPQREVINVKLCFEDVIYMEVIQESFADGIMDEPSDEFEGSQIKRFKQSGYLDFLKRTRFSFWELIHDDSTPFTHYRICGLNSVLEIITLSEPTIASVISLDCHRKGSPTMYFGGKFYK